MSKRVLVTGASGFIGGHLVNHLKKRGYFVSGVDLEYPEYPENDDWAQWFTKMDLRGLEACYLVTKGMDEVYHLAADMGGMAFISKYQSQILHNNSLIDINMLEAARLNGVKKFFYSSSACIYPEFKQTETNVVPLREEDAYPAQPQDTYGWEKLMMEILLENYEKEYGIQTRVARFHNIFGPYGTWTGGREKAPAAMCRKVAEAKLNGLDHIEIWGDGEQTRSFCYIDDLVDGVYRLMNSDHNKPLNIGQDRMISINQLADMVMDCAGVKLEKRYVDGPQGVRGRNSDNTKLREVLDWEPQISLEDGLKITYNWIEEQVRNGNG
jgi:GDP-D-mannose 3', 5'-epimerase